MRLGNQQNIEAMRLRDQQKKKQDKKHFYKFVKHL